MPRPRRAAKPALPVATRFLAMDAGRDPERLLDLGEHVGHATERIERASIELPGAPASCSHHEPQFVLSIRSRYIDSVCRRVQADKI